MNLWLFQAVIMRMRYGSRKWELGISNINLIFFLVGQCDRCFDSSCYAVANQIWFRWWWTHFENSINAKCVDGFNISWSLIIEQTYQFCEYQTNSLFQNEGKFQQFISTKYSYVWSDKILFGVKLPQKKKHLTNGTISICEFKVSTDPHSKESKYYMLCSANVCNSKNGLIEQIRCLPFVHLLITQISIDSSSN